MDVSREFPRIAPDEKGIKTLFVNGKPFLIRGGELHNSSASSAAYMEQEVWPWLRGLNMNTVLLPIAWEDIEPEEGAFDFSLLDTLLQQARREDMHLILLWFGLWKNGESYYVPRWVKQDDRQYFRIKRTRDATCDTISPFCAAAVEKDRQAFCRLMTHLSQHDTQHTVIMMQVENEIGLLGAQCDQSETTRRLLTEDIPAELAALYGAEGSWEEAFGADAGEYLMAYTYAKAAEEIAAAGKAIWPLPMYVNAWQDQHPARPGIYPSGGPIAKMIPLWRRCAPSIDLCAPDVYAADFAGVCERYLADENPLFIPETVRTPMAASNVFYVFGALNGLGYAPFGIEDILKQKAPETPAYLAESYRLLQGLEAPLLAARGTPRLQAFIRRSPNEAGCILSLSGCDLQLDYLPGGGDRPSSGGLVLEEENGFWLVGCNLRYALLPKVGSDSRIGLPRVEEGLFVDGEWRRGRILNGDEVHGRTIGDVPACRYIGLNP